MIGVVPQTTNLRFHRNHLVPECYLGLRVVPLSQEATAFRLPKSVALISIVAIYILLSWYKLRESLSCASWSLSHFFGGTETSDHDRRRRGEAEYDNQRLGNGCTV